METLLDEDCPLRQRLLHIVKKGYVNKKIHIQRLKVFPNLNVDNVDKLSAEKMFADIYNVSSAHGYQQITVHTIF